MPSTILFLCGTLLLSLNFVRPFGLAISDWIYFFALLLAILETFTIDRGNVSCWIGNKLLPFAWAILMGGLISMFRSQFPTVASVELTEQIYAVTLFVSLVWVMVRRGQTEKLVTAFIVSGIFAASVAAFDYLSGASLGNVLSGTVGRSYWGRYAGPLGHPNKLGYFLVLTATITIARLAGARKPNLITYGVALLVQLFAIYLSGSVTAYLGIATGLGAALIASRQVRRRMLIYSSPIVALLVVVSLLPWTSRVSPLKDLLTGIMGDVDRVRDTTALSRIDIYRLAIDQVAKDLIVGVGYDQLSTSSLAPQARLLPGSIHNTFLQLLYSGGLLAFVGTIGLYAYLAYSAIQALHPGKRRSLTLVGLAASVLAMALMDQFQDAIYQREQWLTAGLFLGTWWSTVEGQNLGRPRSRSHRWHLPGEKARILAQRGQESGSE